MPPRRCHLRWTLVLIPVVFAGCGRKTPPSSVGSEVEAPVSDGTMGTARVAELYGKLARVQFERGGEAWVLASELEPPATSRPPPPDACAVAQGDRVRAPWSPTEKMYAGRVTEVHGRIAEVQFDDGDKTWTPCDAIRPYDAGE